MNSEILASQLTFKAVRSSGPGGQHVNKTSTKVEASLDLTTTTALTADEIEIVKEKLKNRISIENILTINCSESRSQHRNKTLVVERFINLIQQALKKRKPRKKSKPCKGAIEKRIRAKKNNALKKANRKPPKIE